jgi:hypothetical protein
MKGCTYGATLEELLNRPMGMLALHGRDGEDEDAKSEDETESEEDAKSDEDNEEDGKDDKSKKSEKPATVESLTRQLANSEEARNRNADKRREAETALTEAKKTIAKLQKDGTPDDAVKQENESLQTTNATLVAANQSLMLQVALRDDKSHDWEDPDAVLTLADLSEVEFDERTNRAIGLKAALDKLAKNKPYLLKKAKDDSKDDDKEDKQDKRRTGTPPAPRKPASSTAAAAEAARLRAKYPALRR